MSKLGTIVKKAHKGKLQRYLHVNCRSNPHAQGAECLYIFLTKSPTAKKKKKGPLAKKDEKGKNKVNGL